MLYYLFEWLHKYDFPGARMFGYVSFRALMAIILALLISSIFGNKFIDLLKRKQIVETQRDASIDPFGVNKVGVPSMGGVIIIVAILIPCLLLGKLHNIYMILMLITTVWLGSLGFADDYIKIFKKDKEGLHGKFKVIGQVGLGLIVGLTLYFSTDVVIRENFEVQKPGNEIEVIHATKNIKSTQTTIPFFKSNNLDYADLVSFMGKYAQAAGWILFVIITIFVVTAVSNGANLNDGMDGMAAGNSAIIGLTLGILAYVSSHIEYAGYLNIMYIPGSEELVIYICAFIGALIGFLWYNAYPAQVFMGDTGSLTIGGIIAVFAIIIHKELLIPILCGVFLVENLSVILQVNYFKRGKKKGIRQRIFKRTPIHDHFRTAMSQLDPGCTYRFTKPNNLLHESKITIRFWIVTIVLAAITIITLKIR
ncbi:phospho-N-acetylmuramoyl-pentapeptide-transferase [uncultured Bacteroides sp.]|uniref:phospho-N-acetylmuramoyl-pentapeptide- transferase n=1 Tax=uncultured Bacteroides sp. TaxID=162156 RepID=UPI002AA6E1A0|nr:phospho-N-acetylmuramoyl-pentapeptide-transferase [uncultured Bacteroides sp.]